MRVSLLYSISEPDNLLHNSSTLRIRPGLVCLYKLQSIYNSTNVHVTKNKYNELDVVDNNYYCK